MSYAIFDAAAAIFAMLFAADYALMPRLRLPATFPPPPLRLRRYAA